MTDRLTLKLALQVESGEIVGGINTGNSVLISRLHTLPATIDIFDAEIAMFVRACPGVEYPERSALLQ